MANVRKREWASPANERKFAWEVAYRDQDGQRRSKQFKLKKQADAYRLKVETELEAGAHVADSKSCSIRELCKEYLIYSETRIVDGRIGKMRHRSIDMAVRRSIVPNVGAIRVKDLTAVRVEKLYVEMTQKDGLKPKSARYRLQMLKQIVDFGVKHGYVRTNVVPVGIRELRGFAQPVIRTFKPEEVARLLKAAEEKRTGQHEHSHAMIRLVVNIAAFCGLRYGEIMGLALSNIDFGRRLICVRKNLSRMDGLKSPKTPAGKRDVPMPGHIAALLREYIDEYFQPNPEDLIIRTGKGNRVVHSSFHHAHWDKLLACAGLLDDGERFHFHALRHFAASWMIENGLSVMDVAALLGHAKFDMTLQTYAHSIMGGNHRHDAFDRMSQALIQAPLLLEAAYEQQAL